MTTLINFTYKTGSMEPRSYCSRSWCRAATPTTGEQLISQADCGRAGNEWAGQSHDLQLASDLSLAKLHRDQETGSRPIHIK